MKTFECFRFDLFLTEPLEPRNSTATKTRSSQGNYQLLIRAVSVQLDELQLETELYKTHSIIIDYNRLC